MPAKVNKLGPGYLTIGEVGTEVDFSCQVTAAHVDWTADVAEETTVLCGEVIPGARTYTSELAGTLLQDLDDGGIVDYSWDHRGEQVAVRVRPGDRRRGGGGRNPDPRPPDRRRRRGRTEHGGRFHLGDRRNPGVYPGDRRNLLAGGESMGDEPAEEIAA